MNGDEKVSCYIVTAATLNTNFYMCNCYKFWFQ